jgi:hypothetical protein
MAGALTVGPDLVWVPARWIHDRVLRQLAAEVRDAFPTLATLLLDARVEGHGVASGNLSRCGPDEIRALVAAARRCYDRAFVAGPSIFMDPEQWPALLWQIAELRALLRWKQRDEGHADGGGVMFPSGEAWHVPAWLNDLMAEQLVAGLLPEHAYLAHALLDSRDSPQQHIDLRRLDSAELDKVRIAAEPSRERYEKERRHVLRALAGTPQAEVMTTIADAYDSLSQRLSVEGAASRD